MLDINQQFAAKGKWIIPASHSGRAIGMSTDSEVDKNHYAEVYAIAHDDWHGRHTDEEVAKRLIACVNACAGIPNEQLELDNVLFVEMLKERNSIKQSPAQNQV